jgi:2-methylisocitrate lyase-like PEP mutase family enzyme
VVNGDLMERKIIVARETADVFDNPDFIINARTDALRSMWIDQWDWNWC